MVECKKCGHIGQPKTQSRYNIDQKILIVIVSLFLMYPVWYIATLTFFFVGNIFFEAASMFEISASAYYGWVLTFSIIYILTVYLIMMRSIEVCEKCGKKMEKEDPLISERDPF